MNQIYDGKQVLRFVTKYKSKDLFNIGQELTKRKGTGNYDKERTQFNVDYVPLTERNLYQQVKQNLKNRDIEYLNKSTTNLLNGVTFTSGAEFFQSLGMEFVDSGRTYKKGDKKGQSVLVPNIKNKNDIPVQVTYYFDCCMEFLEKLVGKENIVMAQVHYDEDTPHMQAYFLPIVNQVKRKMYVKDENGIQIKEEVKDSKGNVKLVPKLMRDNNGNIMYEVVNGKFLNNDQFWKDLGGKNSFAKLQDKFNKFINERGFKLDRGNIGSGTKNKTKLEYQVEELKEEIKDLKEEINNSNKEIEMNKKCLKNLEKSSEKTELKKGITGYNSKDVERLIYYAKDLEKDKVLSDNTIQKQEETIERLQNSNNRFKANKEYLRQKELLKKQQSEIKELNNTIEEQNLLIHSLNSIKRKLESQITTLTTIFSKLTKAIDKVLGRKGSKSMESYENLADAINHDYYDYNKKSKNKDDFDISL